MEIRSNLDHCLVDVNRSDWFSDIDAQCCSLTALLEERAQPGDACAAQSTAKLLTDGATKCDDEVKSVVTCLGVLHCALKARLKRMSCLGRYRGPDWAISSKSDNLHGDILSHQVKFPFTVLFCEGFARCRTVLVIPT